MIIQTKTSRFCNKIYITLNVIAEDSKEAALMQVNNLAKRVCTAKNKTVKVIFEQNYDQLEAGVVLEEDKTITAEVIKEVLYNNSMVTDLDIYKLKVSDEQLRIISEGLNANTSLKYLRLYLYECGDEWEKNLKIVGKNLMNSKIEVLEVSYNDYGYKIAKALKLPETLKTLGFPFYYNQAENEPLVEVLKSVQNSKVEKLRLDFGDMGIEKVKYIIGEGFKYITNIKEIYFGSNLEVEVIKLIFDNLFLLSNLMVLDFGWNNLKEAIGEFTVGEMLIEAIAKNSNIVDVKISGEIEGKISNFLREQIEINRAAKLDQAEEVDNTCIGNGLFSLQMYYSDGLGTDMLGQD